MATDTLNRSLVPDSVRRHYNSRGLLDSLLWRAGDTIHYSYTTAGDLDTLAISLDNQYGDQREHYRFHWDALGRRQQIDYPYFGMTVTWAYDRLGTLRRVLASNPGSSLPDNRFNFTFRQDSVDLLGRALHEDCTNALISSAIANPCIDWVPDTSTTTYYRTGGIAVQQITRTSEVTDTFRYDIGGRFAGGGPSG